MKILRFDADRIGILKDGDRVVDVSPAIRYASEKGPQRVRKSSRSGPGSILGNSIFGHFSIFGQNFSSPAPAG